MKKCYLDSNFLIYFKDENAPQHNLVVDKMAKLAEEGTSFFVSQLVIDEFIYVLKNYPGLKKDKNIFQILKTILQQILEIPFLMVVNPPTDTNSQVKTIDLMEKYNLSPRDAYHLLTMMSQDIEILATFDNHFKSVFAEKIVEEI